MAARWSVPRAWPGARVFILGGGASLTGFDAGVLRGRGRTIAIKEAGLTMAPWADVLFWSDAWWIDGNRAHDGNRDRLGLHTGSWKIGRSPIQGAGGHDVKILGHDGKAALSESPRGLAGACSGGSAINLAFLFGARGIVLLGYDMQGGNWDGRPRKAALSNRYATHFIPAIERMAPRLRALGVTVINATPGSRLTCFPHRPLEAILDETDSTEDGALPAAPPPRPSPARGEGDTGTAADLSRTPFARLERAIAALAAAAGGEAVAIRVALGPYAPVRRSPAWWRLKLRAAFATVTVSETGPGFMIYRCRDGLIEPGNDEGGEGARA